MGMVPSFALGLACVMAPSVWAVESVPVSLNVSPNPASGSITTFTPVYPDGFVVPDDATCSWELLWGNTASLLNHTYDETFGSILVRGRSADGYCSPWQVSLPYSASASWIYNYVIGSPTVVFDTSAIAQYAIMSGANGAPTGTGIASSTLPGVWLSLPHGGQVGDDLTATAHPFGGYVQPPNGAHWAAGVGPSGKVTDAETNHSLTFTFTATQAGVVSVFYNDTGEMSGDNFAGAGIDPRVEAAPPPPTPAPTPRPPTPAPATKPPITATPTTAANASERAPGPTPTVDSDEPEPSVTPPGEVAVAGSASPAQASPGQDVPGVSTNTDATSVRWDLMAVIVLISGVGISALVANRRLRSRR